MADAERLAQGVLAGKRLSLARAISLVEDEQPAAPHLLSALYPHTGKAHIIGVTGAPGSGKSTLVTMLVRQLRTTGKTVAIVAVDPTSPFSGGALLGDRVRMRALAGDSGIFIRSMATRGSLGGLSKTTNDAVVVLDAAGFDYIIVETVGVGQAEIEIASTAHTTLVVEAPGMGDEVQAIKAGLLEIGDILVVNKADRPGADKAVKALQMVLAVDSGVTRQTRHHGQLMDIDVAAMQKQEEANWDVPVLKTISTTGEGIDQLSREIEAHYTWLVDTGQLNAREEWRICKTIENIIRAELNRRIGATVPADQMASMIHQIRTRQSDPYQIAQSLLEELPI